MSETAAPSESGQQVETTQPMVEQPNVEQPQDHGDDNRAGGQKQILADLAKERDNRQRLQNELAEMRTGFAKALGLAKEEATPEQLAQQLKTAQTGEQDARRELAIWRAAAANGANPDALLDSARFLKSLAQIQPDDSESIAAAIKTAVENNPALAAQTSQPVPGAGWGDAQQRSNNNISDADAKALAALGFSGF